MSIFTQQILMNVCSVLKAPGGSLVKNLSMQEKMDPDPWSKILEEVATHSSILVFKSVDRGA